MSTLLPKTRALVVFSGGQDSATCLVDAIYRYDEVFAISFYYGQKHTKEITSQYQITRLLQKRYPNIFKKHIKVEIDIPSPSTLTSTMQEFNPYPEFPNTFVPLRNMILLTLAASYAIAQKCQVILTGVNAIDYSGYPDCRPEFLNKLREAVWAALGKEGDSVPDIIAPLIAKNKTQIVEHAMHTPLGKDILALTHTCYNNQYPPCMQCDSCRFRALGFAGAGIADPIFDAVLRNTLIKEIEL
jgi:7-cyano-7-deazaguanine synthase